MARFNLSGALAADATAQDIRASGISNGFGFQNISDIDLWIRIGGVATADSPSIKIGANAIYVTPANERVEGQISVIGATAGKKFTAWSW